MNGFKTLTFKEISDAFNTGKHVEVAGSHLNPFRLDNGRIVDVNNDPTFTSNYVFAAMQGERKARIVEPKLTRWVVVHRFEGDVCTPVYDSKKDAEREEEYWMDKGLWIRTVKVEV